MSNTPEIDPTEPDPHIAEVIQQTAAKYGVELDQERLQRLQVAAEKMTKMATVESGNTYFDQDGVGINLPNRPRKAVSKEPRDATIDFVPSLPSTGEGVNSARRGATSLFTLNALHALQDYSLLVESGYSDKPASIIGFTNPQMEKVAGRVGFTHAYDEYEYDKIAVDFDVMRDAVFSPEIRRLETLLLQRQNNLAQRLGASAAQ